MPASEEERKSVQLTLETLVHETRRLNASIEKAMPSIDYLVQMLTTGELARRAPVGSSLLNKVREGLASARQVAGHIHEARGVASELRNAIDPNGQPPPPPPGVTPLQPR